MGKLDQIVSEILPQVVELRHDLHAHPELGYEESRTAEALAAHLGRLENLQMRTALGNTTGIAAILNGHKAPPALLLRADMDALPIQEQNDVAYKSQVPGKMHACGHDGHMACLVGTAMILSRTAEELPGPVVFLFQPAEEGGGGGRIMVEAGVLDDPKVGAAFALHGWPRLPIGKVGIAKGPSMAATDTFHVIVTAEGAHAAQPHRSADPILVAAKIIDNIQQIASRMVDPVQPVVVTVGQIHGGTAVNIIPDRVEMHGTIRTLSEGTRSAVADRLQQICTHTAEAFGAEAKVTVKPGYPILHDDPTAAELVARVARDLFGTDAVEHLGPSMGAEDFAYYLQKVPGAVLRLGLASPDRPSRPLHHPRFDFDDEALPIGMKMLAEVARRWLVEAHG